MSRPGRMIEPPDICGSSGWKCTSGLGEARAGSLTNLVSLFGRAYDSGTIALPFDAGRASLPAL